MHLRLQVGSRRFGANRNDRGRLHDGFGQCENIYVKNIKAPASVEPLCPSRGCHFPKSSVWGRKTHRSTCVVKLGNAITWTRTHVSHRTP